MRYGFRVLATAILLLSSGGAALAQTAPAPAPAPASAMPGMSKGSSPDSNGADAAMMAGMKTMQHDMGAAPMTGDPDKDFVAMMIPHHQGAIDMAEVERRYGKDPMLRRLALDIIKAQRSEIAMMKGWQARHAAH